MADAFKTTLFCNRFCNSFCNMSKNRIRIRILHVLFSVRKFYRNRKQTKRFLNIAATPHGQFCRALFAVALIIGRGNSRGLFKGAAEIGDIAVAHLFSNLVYLNAAIAQKLHGHMYAVAGEIARHRV